MNLKQLLTFKTDKPIKSCGDYWIQPNGNSWICEGPKEADPHITMLEWLIENKILKSDGSSLERQVEKLG